MLLRVEIMGLTKKWMIHSVVKRYVERDREIYVRGIKKAIKKRSHKGKVGLRSVRG